MKISIEHYDDTITIETKNNDLTTCEVVDHMYALCIAAGFNSANVADAFYDKGIAETDDNIVEDTQHPTLSSSKTMPLFEIDIEPYDGLLRDDTPFTIELQDHEHYGFGSEYKNRNI